MGFFDRFKKKEKSVLPDEVQQYYQSEKRQKTGVAALLGLLALVITVAIASALFFGGRFVYRQVNDSDNKTAQQEQKHTPETSSTKTPENQKKQNGQGTQAPQATPRPEPTPAPAPSPSPQPRSNATPSLGDTPAPLPHTGDPGM